MRHQTAAASCSARASDDCRLSDGQREWGSQRFAERDPPQPFPTMSLCPLHVGGRREPRGPGPYQPGVGLSSIASGVNRTLLPVPIRYTQPTRRHCVLCAVHVQVVQYSAARPAPSSSPHSFLVERAVSAHLLVLAVPLFTLVHASWFVAPHEIS